MFQEHLCGGSKAINSLSSKGRVCRHLPQCFGKAMDKEKAASCLTKKEIGLNAV